MHTQYIKPCITDYLVSNSLDTPSKTAFITLTDTGEETPINYRELCSRVSAVTTQLAERHLKGKRVLLFYLDTIDFIVSFLACQAVGIVAVPVPFMKGKKQAARLAGIMNDSRATAILCKSHSATLLQELLPPLHEGSIDILIFTDLADHASGDLPAENFEPDSTAFIQYTSGSTARPKGVIISVKNLLHNEALIKNTFTCQC